MQLTANELEATHMRDDRYAVRPVGQLGTAGFHPRPWTVAYVKARTPRLAVARAIAEAQRRHRPVCS